MAPSRSSTVKPRRSHSDSDEAYVVDLCDAILEEPASRQHRFDWLVGDPGRNGARRTLPVDAYYADHRLVVEYRERQRDEAVAHFDKPGVLTIGGVRRGIQRRIYDDRRAAEIPVPRTPLDRRHAARSSDRPARETTTQPGHDLAALRCLLSDDC